MSAERQVDTDRMSDREILGFVVVYVLCLVVIAVRVFS